MQTLFAVQHEAVALRKKWGKKKRDLKEEHAALEAAAKTATQDREATAWDESSTCFHKRVSAEEAAQEAVKMVEVQLGELSESWAREDAAMVRLKNEDVKVPLPASSQ